MKPIIQKTIFCSTLFVLVIFQPIIAQENIFPDNINVRNTSGEPINLNQFLKEKNKEDKEVLMVTSFNFCSYCIDLAKAIHQNAQQADLNLEVILFINGKVGEGYGGKNKGFESYTEYKKFIQDKELQDLTHIHSQDGSFEQLVFKGNDTQTPVIMNINEYAIYHHELGYFPPQRGLDLPRETQLDFHVLTLIDRIKSHQTGYSEASELTNQGYTLAHTFKTGTLRSRTIINNKTADTIHELKIVDGKQEAYYKKYAAETETQVKLMLITRYIDKQKKREEIYMEPKSGGELKIAQSFNYVYGNVNKKFMVSYYPNGQICVEDKWVDGETQSFAYDEDGSQVEGGGRYSMDCKQYWKFRKE